ncbi:MAG: flagellar brake protein [Thauera sp.]|nr:flagellar brake protein [Thauera sp.]
MATEHNQTRVELVHADDESRFILRDPREILQLLKSLVSARALTTAHLEPGNQSFLTVILDLVETGGALLIDGSKDEAINQQVEKAERIICITQLDRIRIQFALPGVTKRDQVDGPVFAAPLPTEVLRLQRRDFYRLSTPVTQTATCAVPLELPDGARKTVSLRILDISGGGIAVVVPPSDLPFAPGMTFNGCELKLPELEPIRTRLTVRNLFRLVTRNGVEMLRAGCEFSDLPPQAESIIQRYILKIERERNARERGAL